MGYTSSLMKPPSLAPAADSDGAEGRNPGRHMANSS